MNKFGTLNENLQENASVINSAGGLRFWFLNVKLAGRIYLT